MTARELKENLAKEIMTLCNDFERQTGANISMIILARFDADAYVKLPEITEIKIVAAL